MNIIKKLNLFCLIFLLPFAGADYFNQGHLTHRIILVPDISTNTIVIPIDTNGMGIKNEAILFLNSGGFDQLQLQAEALEVLGKEKNPFSYQIMEQFQASLKSNNPDFYYGEKLGKEIDCFMGLKQAQMYMAFFTNGGGGGHKNSGTVQAEPSHDVKEYIKQQMASIEEPYFVFPAITKDHPLIKGYEEHGLYVEVQRNWDEYLEGFDQARFHQMAFTNGGGGGPSKKSQWHFENSDGRFYKVVSPQIYWDTKEVLEIERPEAWGRDCHIIQSTQIKQ